MAHFAFLDKDNIVAKVIVIGNDALKDEEGIEQEYLGIAECIRLLGPGRWVQTSYNSNFRGHFAGIGDTYDRSLDLFISKKPENNPSFVLNTKVGIWEPPIPYPNDGNTYYWDEYDQEWLLSDAFIPGRDDSWLSE